jgi:hypothetical protein
MVVEDGWLRACPELDSGGPRSLVSSVLNARSILARGFGERPSSPDSGVDLLLASLAAAP